MYVDFPLPFTVILQGLARRIQLFPLLKRFLRSMTITGTPSLMIFLITALPMTNQRCQRLKQHRLLMIMGPLNIREAISFTVNGLKRTYELILLTIFHIFDFLNRVRISQQIGSLNVLQADPSLTMKWSFNLCYRD